MNSGSDALTTREPPGNWKLEAAGIAVLVVTAIYFLAVSWRKWPDPIADSGLQWYAFWRLGHGELLYHDIIWNYGPLSAYFNAALFKIFGPGMMVLVAANLVIYAGIVSLAYLLFRKAWGRLGAFAACAVFISVFSFSRLNSIANYNYATPYAHESTHGMLLLLATIFVAVRWCCEPSAKLAFALGLCGGIATVLKPEFMLAGGLVGIAACALRFLQKKPAGVRELSLIAAGLILPTLLFTIWFACSESVGNAFVDASRAWWMVLVDRSQGGAQMQQIFTGADQPGVYFRVEFHAAMVALRLLVFILAVGWLVNRVQSVAVRAAIIIAAGPLLWFASLKYGWNWYEPRINKGWYETGYCFPGLIAVIFIMLGWRLWREIKAVGRVDQRTVMALLLTLGAGAMLARMLLHARIQHLGFYQAALAGMVIAAFIVAELPRWTGAGVLGRRVACMAGLLLLTLGCASIAAQSHFVLTDQTQSVGTGSDRFFATTAEVDETGLLVNWAVEHMQAAPQESTLFVYPEGVMINFLSRRKSPCASFQSDEQLLERLQKSPPDYVILISRDLGESGIRQLGTPGNPGFSVVNWFRKNYGIADGRGGDPLVTAPGSRKGVLLLRRNPPSSVAPAGEK